MIDINEKKNKIITFLQNNGPALPVRISKVIEMEPVFASAILSELYNDKRVKMSNMKIGSSSLFFLPGQEDKLENFIENLKTIEKEAFFKLKEKKVLSDEEQDPAIRVAIRGIKDFAVPFEREGKGYWKFVFTSDAEIEKIFNPKIENKKIEETESEKSAEKEVKEEVKEIPMDEKEVKVPEKKEKKEMEKTEAEKNKKQWRSNRLEGRATEQDNESIKVVEIFDEEKSEFFEEIKNFLKKNDIQVIAEIQADKKEVVAKIILKTKISNLNYLLIAKNKKTLSKEEINVVLQRSSYHKMPCLLVLRKEPSKSILGLLKETNFIALGIME